MKTRYEVTTVVDADGKVVSSRIHQGQDKTAAIAAADKGLKLMEENRISGIVQVSEIKAVDGGEVSSIIYEKKN